MKKFTTMSDFTQRSRKVSQRQNTAYKDCCPSPEFAGLRLPDQHLTCELNSFPQESDNDDLDDDAMMRLDETLAAAFRGMMRGGRKAGEKERLRQLKHYKMRCLDLVEVYIHNGAQASALLVRTSTKVPRPALCWYVHPQRSPGQPALCSAGPYIYNFNTTVLR